MTPHLLPMILWSAMVEPIISKGQRSYFGKSRSSVLCRNRYRSEQSSVSPRVYEVEIEMPPPKPPPQSRRITPTRRTPTQTLLIIILPILLLLLSLLSQLPLPQPDLRTLLGRNEPSVLILTAHPDDECMFFGPTLVALKAQGIKTSGLSLSQGEPSPLGPSSYNSPQVLDFLQLILGIKELISLVEPLGWGFL